MERFFTHKVLFAAAAVAIIALYGLTMLVPSTQSVQPAATPGIVVSQQVSAPPTIVDLYQEEQASSTSAPPLFPYIEIVDSCGPYFGGVCVNMRSGPGTEYPAVMKLRTGMVLKVAGTVVESGRTWYKIAFDEQILYPKRVTGGWYIAADYVQLFMDVGEQQLSAKVKTPSVKHIVVDRSQQMLYAYDGDTLFMQEPISTGLEFTPTPLGIFSVYKKTPSRYMQGPVPGVSDQYYDLPGVPWDLYFTYGGAVIHGAYWHDHFGQPWSHGCVNLPPQKAKELYQWADVGTVVVVQE